jgi:hypothetical protein
MHTSVVACVHLPFFFLPVQQRPFLRLQGDNHSRGKMIGGALVNARFFSASFSSNPFLLFALHSMNICRDKVDDARPLAFPKTDADLTHMLQIFEASCVVRDETLFHRTLGVQLLSSKTKAANPAFNTSIDRLNNANPFHNHQPGCAVPNLFN